MYLPIQIEVVAWGRETRRTLSEPLKPLGRRKYRLKARERKGNALPFAGHTLLELDVPKVCCLQADGVVSREYTENRVGISSE